VYVVLPIANMGRGEGGRASARKIEPHAWVDRTSAAPAAARSWQLFLDDRALTRLRGRSIGFIFQHHLLISAFTALENVMTPLLVERGFPDAAMKKRALDLLIGLGLEQWCNHPSNVLSGGQQQRVAVARAHAMDPALVLADEPTGNLDTKSAEGVFELMRQVNQKSHTSFLIVTHSIVIGRDCDRIIELVDGRITHSTAA